jgi:hypothetical protein
MSPSLVVADCPRCRAIGTVILGTCEVCFAEFNEDDRASSRGADDAGTISGQVAARGSRRSAFRGG